MLTLWWSILGSRFFPFNILNISCHSLLFCKVSGKNQLIALWGFPCMWFFLFLFLPLEFSRNFLTFAILIMICLGVGLFGFIFFETLCNSCTWILVSFFRFSKCSVIISWNTFSTFLSLLLWDPYNLIVSILDVVPGVPSTILIF